MIHTVVIADDITGANDIGIMYAKTGMDTVVYSYEMLKDDFTPQHEVTIIDTNSRLCTYGEAYNRVFTMLKRIGADAAKQFISKQCSVFRGNIGAEFDAMLDALGEKHGMVVLGFPDNGRTTINGIHYVHGVPLAESQFRNDPVHPMKQSSLIEILQGQTKRRVSIITHETLDKEILAIQKEVTQLKKEADYIIFDVRDNHDLYILSQVLKNERVICGSSALGFYLAKQHVGINENENVNIRREATCKQKILSVAGSLTPQTKSQTEYMRQKGYPVIAFDTKKLFLPEERGQEFERVLQEYERLHNTADTVLIHSLQNEYDVNRTKEMAKEFGIGNTAISEMVSGELAELAAVISERYAVSQFIICGGDTSASFCRRMGISGMKVLYEIEPGIPFCQSITAPYYSIVLKSGSFGKESFIETASYTR